MSRFDKDPREVKHSFSQRLKLDKREALSIDNSFALRYDGENGRGWGLMYIAAPDSVPVAREELIDKVNDRKVIDAKKISLIRVPFKLGTRLQRVFIGEYTLSVRSPNSKECTIEISSPFPIEVVHFLGETELREYLSRVSNR